MPSAQSVRSATAAARLHLLYTHRSGAKIRVLQPALGLDNQRFHEFRHRNYLDDVAIGFRNARGRVADDEAGLVQAIRLALISSTITSLGGILAASLVAEAVKRSIWPAARAIGLVTTMESSLDQRELCWKLLEVDHLTDSEREELQDLLALAERGPSVSDFDYWAELRSAMDKIRGRWTPQRVVDRSLALLCAVEPLLTATLSVEERLYESPVVRMHQKGKRDDIEVAHEEMAKTEPGAAREIVLAKLNYLRTMSRRGFEAIRSVPGFSEAERAEAAALLTFALEPTAPTLGVPKCAVKKRARLLEADTIVRIAGGLTASQAKTLIESVLHSGARVERYKGNPNRARALAALAERLPKKLREAVRRRAVRELVRMVETAQKEPKKRKDASKWQGQPLEVAIPDEGKPESVMVFFDDHAAVDEGIDIAFSSYVEELSDLEVEFASFGAAVEALADVIPEEDLPKLLGLAVSPLSQYGWICVPAICALEPRLKGQLAELRDDLLDRSLETLEHLPKELQREHWRRLAPLLDDARIERALREYHVVDDANAQARAFAVLAPRLGEEFRRQQAEELLEGAEQLADGEKKRLALTSIAPLLDETIEGRAIELALNLECSADAMQAVAILAPHLSEGARTRAVETAYERGVRDLPDNNYEDLRIAEAWADLMPFLTPDQRSKGLEHATDLVVDQALPSDFKAGVRRLGPFLDKTAVERLEAYQWETPKELLLLVRSSGGHLFTVAEQSDLLDQIDTLPSTKDRVECLLELLPYVSDELRVRGADSAWKIAVREKDHLTASKLAQHVSTDLMTSTMAELDYSTPWALNLVSAIGEHLGPGSVGVVGTMTAEFPNHLDFLTRVMGSLDDAGRADVLRQARSVEDPGRRSSATLALLPFLDETLRRETTADNLASLRGGSRAGVLAACTDPAIIGALSDESVTAVADDIVAICQDWEWL